MFGEEGGKQREIETETESHLKSQFQASVATCALHNSYLNYARLVETTAEMVI